MTDISPEIPVLGSRSALEGSADALFAALYSELRKLAQYQISRNGQWSMSATTLVHQTYINVAGCQASFAHRAQFISYAARVMRGLIVDQARRVHAGKRSGTMEALTDRTGGSATVTDRDAVRVGDALDGLARFDRRLAELVELKFFCGLAVVEIAAIWQKSERTVQREWEKARLYLQESIGDGLL